MRPDAALRIPPPHPGERCDGALLVFLAGHGWSSLIVYAFLFVAPIVTLDLSVASGDAIRTLAIFSACLIGHHAGCAKPATASPTLLKARWRARDRYGGDACSQGWRRSGIRGDLLSPSPLFMVWVAHPRYPQSIFMAASTRTEHRRRHRRHADLSPSSHGDLRRHSICPEDIKRRMPLLEERLNAFCPESPLRSAGSRCCWASSSRSPTPGPFRFSWDGPQRGPGL